MTRIADPLRERVAAMCAASGLSGERLYAIADAIDAEHEARMERCRRGTRRDFAHYMRSCMEDYVNDVARQNRNHAHARVTDSESDEATCTQCGRGVGVWDHYCCHCGAKLTAVEYEEVGDG